VLFIDYSEKLVMPVLPLVICRLVDVSAALNTLPDQVQKDQSRKLLGSSCTALEVAAAAAGAYRDASACRWVNLGSLFGQMKPNKGVGI
jgi:hypothetical protein